MHNIEAERSLVAALLLEPDNYRAALEQLAPEDIEDPDAAAAFGALQQAAGKGMPADIVSAVQQLGERWKVYLTRWCEQAPALWPVETYISVIQGNAMGRRIREMLYEDVMYPDGDGAAALCRIEQKIAELRRREISAGSNTQAQGEAYLKKLDGGEVPKRMLTGYVELDRLIGGLPQGELTGIAAKARMGKTTLALNIAARIHKAGYRVLFDSLEMSEEQILQKLAAIYTGLPAEKIRDYQLTPDERQQVKEAVQVYMDGRFEIMPDGYTVHKLTARARQIKADVVFVDYLTYMLPEQKAGSRNDEVGAISRGLKFMAKALGVPVIVLCQLSRASASRQNKAPVLSDLRDSGEIEQDLAVCIFLQRDGEEDHKTPLEQATAIVAKNRFGRTGIADLHFDLSAQRFLSPERDGFSGYGDMPF